MEPITESFQTWEIWISRQKIYATFSCAQCAFLGIQWNKMLFEFLLERKLIANKLGSNFLIPLSSINKKMIKVSRIWVIQINLS